MLIETQVQVPSTSWFMLRNGANQILDPFGFRIYVVQQQRLVPTGNIYHLVQGDQNTLNGFHLNHLAQATGNLPNQNDIQNDADQFEAHEGINVPEARMADNGPAVPVVQVVPANGTPVVTTYGASTCLPLLVRATAANNTLGAGCSHLSADDMTSLQNARNAILHMCTTLRGQLGDLAATCHCYLVGGSGSQQDIANDALNDYARTVAALQILAANAANHITFAGAVVPAVDEDDEYIDVLIAGNHVYYQIGGNDDDSG